MITEFKHQSFDKNEGNSNMKMYYLWWLTYRRSKYIHIYNIFTRTTLLLNPAPKVVQKSIVQENVLLQEVIEDVPLQKHS